MQVGNCPFCLRDGVELQDSHYFSQAVYKGFRAEELQNPNPLVLKAGRLWQSSEQVHDFVFCWECEQIFNRSGENWLVPRLGWQDKGFPLWTLVKTASFIPDPEDADFRTYMCTGIPEIDCHSVAHFGLGVFWKGHAHGWPNCERLSLGTYGDGLRKYLRGEASFPGDMALILRIVPNNQPLWSGRMPMLIDKHPFHWFNFYLRGLDFTLAVGKNIPDYLRHCCFVMNPTRPILAGIHILYDEWATMKKAMAKGTRSKKAAEFLSTPRTHTIKPPTGPDW
jgi:hypothetical protein